MDPQEQASELLPIFKQNQIHTYLTLQDKVILFIRDEVFEIRAKIEGKEVVTFNQYGIKQYEKPTGGQLVQFKEVYGITKLSTRTYLILVTGSEKVGYIKNKPLFKVTQVKFIEIGTQATYQPLLPALKDSYKILQLYYSRYDLSQRVQFDHTRAGYYEHAFFCNYKLTLEHDEYPLRILIKFTFGFVDTSTVEREDVTYKMILISRGDFISAGRRWLRRGLNQENSPCDHFQTQFVLEVDTKQKQTLYSLNQVRNSIALLWSQGANFDFTAPFRVSSDNRKIKAQLKTFIQKSEKLEDKMVLLNLINQVCREGALGHLFQAYFRDVPKKSTSLLWFDYHAEYIEHREACFNRLIEQIREDITDFGYFKMEKHSDDFEFEVIKTQSGIFRTNCIDCLDRSNYVQFLVAKINLLAFLDNHANKQETVYFPFESVEINEMESKFKQLWKNNAAAISCQSTGASAMKMDFYERGRRTVVGRLRDFTIGARRYYFGLFSDYYYQNCMDLHFRKLNVGDKDLQINGTWKKTIALAVSLAAIAGMSYAAYKFASERVEDKVTKIVAGTAGSVLVGVMWLGRIKHNSGLFLQKPILRSEHL